MHCRWMAVEMYACEVCNTSKIFAQGRYFQNFSHYFFFFVKPLLLCSPLHRMMEQEDKKYQCVWSLRVLERSSGAHKDYNEHHSVQ